MPRKLTKLNIYEQDLTGSVDTTRLPVDLELFCIEDCFFTGTLDLGSLPDNLEEFSVIGNEITGVVNFQNLPLKLQFLEISEKKIPKNSFRVGKLPESCHRLTFDYLRMEEIAFEEERDKERVSFMYE